MEIIIPLIAGYIVIGIVASTLLCLTDDEFDGLVPISIVLWPLFIVVAAFYVLGQAPIRLAKWLKSRNDI